MLQTKITCAAALLGLALSGCSITGGLARDMERSLLSQSDPQLVAEAMPMLLVTLDALAQDNPVMQRRAGELRSSYASQFVADTPRQRLHAEQAFADVRSGLCAKQTKLCQALDQAPSEFEAVVADADQIEWLFALASVWATRIQVDAGNWQRLAELPKVRALMQRVIALQPDYAQGQALATLGVMAALLPPSLGGQPEQARDYFARAFAASNDHNLLYKVFDAEYVAWPQLDAQSFDTSIDSVLNADPAQWPAAWRLTNSLAQQRAQVLKDKADDWF